ncbi:MAG: pilus assembly protein TadG-related protein, partial [Actinomycetota bacterium]|nr:pilus assembly protein TadG-related protein [Actinomycetota bacterium]
MSSQTSRIGSFRRILAERLSSLRRDERGAVLVLVAVSMVAFLGMLGVALDVAAWQQTHRRAQNTADAGALAAANAMAGGATTTAAQSAATTIITQNDPTITSPTVTFDTTNAK